MSRYRTVRGLVAGVHALWTDDGAPTAVEYGIMVGLIAVVIVGAVGTLGQAVLTNLFERTANAMSAMP